MEHRSEHLQPKLPSHFAASYAYTSPSSFQHATPAATPLRRTARPPVPPRSPSASPSSSPTKKRKRIHRPIDDPDSSHGSRYASYSGVPDYITHHNDVLLCGINPGLTSSTLQHHFASPTNHFYPALYLSGLTARRLSPSEDHLFPSLQPFSLGLTNLGQRPTAEASELTKKELVDGVPLLLRKVENSRPRTVAFVGKGIAEAVTKAVKGSSVKRVTRRILKGLLLSFQTEYGHANEEIKATREATGKRIQVTKDDKKDDKGYGILPFIFRHSRVLTPLASVKEEGCVKTEPCSTGFATTEEYTHFFVSPSTSARVTTHFLQDKADILSHLVTFVTFLQRGAASSTDSHVDLKTESQDTTRLAEGEEGNTVEVEFDVLDIDTIEMLELARQH